MPCPVPWEVWPSMSATNPQGAMGYWNKIHTHFIEIWSDSLTKASRDPTHRFCTFHFLHTSGYWASLLYFSWELGHSILNGVCQPWTRGIKSCPDSCHNGCLSLNTYGSSSKIFPRHDKLSRDIVWIFQAVYRQNSQALQCIPSKQKCLLLWHKCVPSPQWC